MSLPRGRNDLIRQAAVVLLSLMPFAISIGAAEVAWQAITGVATVWRMIAITLVWIGAFAVGTQLFWKVTGALVQKNR